MITATLQVPIYAEDHRLVRSTLSALRDQYVPDDVIIEYEAWVTPDGHVDPALAAATEAGFEIKRAPKGKLTTRNEAHDSANGDVILSIDADAPPIHHYTIASMIDGVREPGVVAANSRPRSRVGPGDSGSLLALGVDMAAVAEDIVWPHMNGQGQAFTAAAWERVGPFDTAVDGRSLPTVRGEEERGFYKRLREIGDVVTPKEAVVYNDMRRHKQKLFGTGAVAEREGSF